MQSTDGNQYWCPRQSLWSLIVEHVPESELPEVRGVLGDSLLDMYTELHSEVEMWCGIWQGIQRGGNHSNRAGTPLLRQQRSPLADPPKVKELLRAEIRMLLQSVRERAIRDGRDGDNALFRYKPDTVNYALGHPNNCPSNCSYPSDCSCPGNTDPSQHGSRPSSCCSVQSSVHDEIEAVRDKLNVTDIDQVVAHLKSVLIEECEALKSQVKHLQENIQQKRRGPGEVDKTEPTIAELREQRRVIQMDLELPSPPPTHFSSSSSSSSPPFMEDLKNRSRLSAGQRALDKTRQPLAPTSVHRPHPPPPLSHTDPSPPVGAPLTKTSASIRPIRTSPLARTQGQHGSTRASSEPSITQTPGSRRITTKGPDASLPGHGSDQLMTKSDYHGVPCQEKERACFHRRTPSSSPSIQMETKRNSLIRPAHRRSLSLSSECVLSPQTERKSSPLLVRRSRTTNDTPSPVPALILPLRDADSYEHSYCSNSNNRCVSATGRPKTQNGRWNSTCGGSLVSATGEIEAKNGRRNSFSESFVSNVIIKRSFMSETGGPLTHNDNDNDSNSKRHSVPATGGRRTQNGSRKTITGINRNNTGHLGKDVTQQQSPGSQSVADHTPSVTPHHPLTNGTQWKTTFTQPAFIQTDGQSFTTIKGPFGGATSQQIGGKQTGPQFPNTYLQPVPPAVPRVSSRGQPLTRQLGLLQADSLVG